MLLSQHDRIHMGLGRTDDAPMTSLEFKNIRNVLNLTQKGIAELLGSSKRSVIRYENETYTVTSSKIHDNHSKKLRKIMNMPIKERKEVVTVSERSRKPVVKRI